RGTLPVQLQRPTDARAFQTGGPPRSHPARRRVSHPARRRMVDALARRLTRTNHNQLPTELLACKFSELAVLKALSLSRRPIGPISKTVNTACPRDMTPLQLYLLMAG